jgi:hypothetical protein
MRIASSFLNPGPQRLTLEEVVAALVAGTAPVAAGAPVSLVVAFGVECP